MAEIQAIFTKKNQSKDCTIMTFACLEQVQTLDYLKFLKLCDQNDQNSLPSLCFNSESDQATKSNKKNKRFEFNSIYNRSQKMKYQFGKVVKQIAQSAINGQNQTLFIYGTQQKCKDKIVFGESQNPGIFLCVLSQLFDLCHEKALEQNVTIKFSCSLYNKAKFIDIFGGNDDCEIQFCKDSIQGGFLHTVPEIIIRNVKTGLKLLNIILKQLCDLREDEYTQNLILTLKLELDCKKTDDETQIFCLSKINLIKLANPSINSSLKGVNKNNVWFVNLLNYIQAPGINSNYSLNNSVNQAEISQIDQNLNEKSDEFTIYLKQICFKNTHKIYGFVSITNKMTSNQCLTALLFANHLKALKIQSNIFILDLPKYYSQRQKNLNSLISVIRKSQKASSLWIQYMNQVENYISQLNYLEFQYSLTIGQACQRLNKYIFTEQLEDFFYAKKTTIQMSQDLRSAYKNVKKIKNIIFALKKRLLGQLNQKLDKAIGERFFDIQFSLAHHFLLQDYQKSRSIVQDALKTFEQQKSKQKLEQNSKIININPDLSYSNLINKKQQRQSSIKKVSSSVHQNQKLKQKQKQNQNKIAGTIKSSLNSCHMSSANQTFFKSQKKSMSPNPIDNLEYMFKNKNIGIANKKNKQLH